MEGYVRPTAELVQSNLGQEEMNLIAILLVVVWVYAWVV